MAKLFVYKQRNVFPVVKTEQKLENFYFKKRKFEFHSFSANAYRQWTGDILEQQELREWPRSMNQAKKNAPTLAVFPTIVFFYD